jgi:hypothetical protein
VKEKQISDNNVARFAEIWQSACKQHIDDLRSIPAKRSARGQDHAEEGGAGSFAELVQMAIDSAKVSP